MSTVQQDAYDDVDEVSSTPFGLIPRANRNHYRKQDIIMDTAAANAGDRVLEVGCGHGIHSERYAKTYDYVGVDISPSLTRATRDRIDDTGLVQQMDVRRLAFEDDTFDAVVGTAILHHLSDQEAALREWLRVTRPGGSVTVMEPNYLFPKDFASAHLFAEERHKTNMAPWRLRRTIESVASEYVHEPRLFTPPYPKRVTGWYDRVDRVLRGVPGVRWAGMMQLIHVPVVAED